MGTRRWSGTQSDNLSSDLWNPCIKLPKEMHACKFQHLFGRWETETSRSYNYLTFRAAPETATELASLKGLQGAWKEQERPRFKEGRSQEQMTKNCPLTSTCTWGEPVSACSLCLSVSFHLDTVKHTHSMDLQKLNCRAGKGPMHYVTLTRKCPLIKLLYVF